MREREHLTEIQIAGYRAGAFDALEKHEIGRHLLKCDFCRQSLPAPTFNDFWNAVMNEREAEQPPAFEQSKFSSRSIASSFPKVAGQFRGLAWSVAALLFVFSLSFLLWLNTKRQWNGEREVAQTFNSNATEYNPAQIESGKTTPPVQIPNQKSNQQNSSPDVSHPVISKSPQASSRQNITESSSKEDVRLNAARKTQTGKPENVSSTRGVLPVKCGSATPVETEIGLSGEVVTLKWKKVPNAIKYHLYISDEEEILVEDFETEQGTAYVLKKPLDPLKTYNLKVIVTLENSKTLIDSSRKFSIKSLKSNRANLKRIEKNEIRCSQTQ